MTLLEFYEAGKKYGVVSAWVLVEYLVFERKVLTFTDTVDKLEYYYEERFRTTMNQYLSEYMQQRGIKIAS